MAKTAVTKSLTEQILDRMFAELEESSEFDSETLERLRQLARKGNLKRAAQVERALKGTGGGQP